jgi:hypothetical protein
MAKKKETAKETEDAEAQDENSAAGNAEGAQAAAETASDEAAPDQASGEESEESGAAGDPTPVSSESPATAPVNLHQLVAKAARDARMGPQEVHFPLHNVELLTGRLKTILPAAIEAAPDETLKSGLQALLNLL